MNRLGLTDQQIAEWLAACEAWAKGKAVQYGGEHEKWADWPHQDTSPPVVWAGCGDVVPWRLKPEPVKVEAWVTVHQNGNVRAFYTEHKDAKFDADRFGYRVAKLTGEFTP